MFRKKTTPVTSEPPSNFEIFESTRANLGAFQALLHGLRSFGDGRNWLFQETMHTYPDTDAADSDELHTLMGVYLLQSGAAQSALMEFKKVSFDFLRDHAAIDFLMCLEQNNLRSGLQKTLKLFIETNPSLESELITHLIENYPNSFLRELVHGKTFSEIGVTEIEQTINRRRVKTKVGEILLLDSDSLSDSLDPATAFDAWLQLAGIANGLKKFKKTTRRLPKLHEVNSSNHNNWVIVSGDLSRNSFEIGENLRPIFIGIRISDEKLLTARNLSMLQKAAPIITLDTATSQLLSFFEVPNFQLGAFAQFLDIKKSNKKVSPSWIDITQWAPKEIQVFSSANLVKSFAALDFESRDVRKFLAAALQSSEIKTSSLAIASWAAATNKSVEFKPRAKYRAASNWPVDAAADAKKQNRLLTCLAAAKTAAEFHQNLQTEFEAEISETREVFNQEIDLPSSSIPQDVVQNLKNQVVSFDNQASSSRHLNIAFGFDQNLVPYFAPVLKQLTKFGTFTADIYVLGRGFGSEAIRELAFEFTKFNFHFYAFDGVDYGSNINTLEHITVSTMDRLFLPELLPDLDQIVYLDTDLAVLSDLWEIGSLNLGNNVLAARPITTEVWGSGWKTFQKAAGRLAPTIANGVRQGLLNRHRLLQTRFINAGVLVLNLRLMRAESFTRKYLGLIEAARFNDQDVLSVYAAGRIHELNTEWNYTPAQVEICQPKIIHWAGPKKPWKPEYVWFKDVFEEFYLKSER